MNEAGDEYRPKAIKKKIDEALKNVNITLWLEQDGQKGSFLSIVTVPRKNHGD